MTSNTLERDAGRDETRGGSSFWWMRDGQTAKAKKLLFCGTFPKT
jgi:hypothetical protein